MSVNIPAWYVQQYSTNLQLMLQQKGSRVRGRCMEGSHVGKQASPVDQMYSVDMSPVTGRFQPIGETDAVEDRRWVFPNDFDLAQKIDSFDKLRLITDPTGKYTENAVYGAGRKLDDVFLANIFAPSFNGQNGTSSIAFPTTLTTVTGGGNVVSVAQGTSGTATGLNVAKLREVKRQFMANEVDLDADPLSMLITSKQHDNLLAEAQVIDMDYTDRPVLVEGKITRFLGIDLIHSERLATGTDDLSGTSTACPVWAKSGAYIGMWKDMQNIVSQRNDLSGHPYQIYTMLSVGACRLDEKRVLKVWCR